MTTEIEVSLYVLVLAVPLGLELVRRVSPLLHTPLMSLTNAISAISVVGAILVAGSGTSPMLSKILGTVAVMFATINIVAGFLITDRMLKMFRKKESGGK
jgi:NAD(P) transhydrogenase subunit alpha